MTRQGKFVSASVMASLLLVAGLPVGSALATPFDGYDHVVRVDDVAGLLANAGRSSTAVVLADKSVDPGGDYVIPSCPDGVDERTDPTCGMIVLGEGSGLFGNGRNELVDGVPTGNLVTPGPLIDCGALELTPDDWGLGDLNGWDLACVEMTNGTISGVRIDNGPDAVPQSPGQGEHRSGILVQPGDGVALVEHTHITDVRRGVLAVAGTGMVTEVIAHANIVRRTELAGMFVLPAQIPTVPVESARIEAAFTANYMDDIGRIGINVSWGIGEGGVRVDADLVDNVVADAFVGLAVFGEGFLTPEYSVGHTVAVSARGGQISARGVGVALLAYGLGPEPDSADNAVKLEVSDVTFGPTTFGPALLVEYDPWGPGNEFVAELEGNHYTGGEPGVVDVCAFSYETFDCVPPGSDPPFQFAGTRADLTAENTNFTFGSVDDAHFGWRSPRPPRPPRPQRP